MEITKGEIEFLINSLKMKEKEKREIEKLKKELFELQHPVIVNVKRGFGKMFSSLGTKIRKGVK